MLNWYFIVAGFSFLWTERLRSRALKPGAWKDSLLRLFFDGLELYFQSALLLGLYFLSLRLPAGENLAPFYPLFFFSGSYLFHLFRKKEELLFLINFVLCVSHASPAAGTGIHDPFLSLAEMTAALVLSTALLLGLHKRQTLSYIPLQMRGLPVDFLTASFLALALWTFQGSLP